MAESSVQVKEAIPVEFASIEEAAEFWDTHSVADYWDEFTDVDIEVNLPRRRQVRIEPTLWDKIASQAHAKGISIETLVNLWLSERLTSS